MKTHRRYYRVDRHQIAFLRFILEAYDGLAVVQTVDSQRGEVVVYIARGCLEEAVGILADLQKTIHMEQMQRPESGPVEML